MREGDFLLLPYSTRNPIEYSIPLLLYQDGGLLDVPSESSPSSARDSCINKLFNIWSTNWIQKSLQDTGKLFINHDLRYADSVVDSSSFSFLRFLGMTPSEAHSIHVAPLLRRRLMVLETERQRRDISFIK